MSEVRTPSEGRVVYPPNLEYSDAWNLGKSGPEGLKKYLIWTLAADERWASAAEYLRFNGAGFHHLTAVQRLDSQGNVIEKVDINIFGEEFSSTNNIDEEEPEYHSHARDSLIYAFYGPKDRQTITWAKTLPIDSPRIPSKSVTECDLAVLNKVVPSDGIGTIYNPSVIGTRLALKTLVVDLPPLAVQRIDSLAKHRVLWRGGIGATVLRQGPVEPPELNTIEGLIAYKDLEREEAEYVDSLRQAIGDVAASTTLLRPKGYNLDTMEERPLRVPADRFPYLTEGVIRSLEQLERSQAAA
jgi:hypothetical protein